MFRKLIDFIDGFLNRITMYRAVLYYLILLLAAAVIFSFFGLLHYSPAGIVSSLIIILIVSWITNKIFASVFKVPANAESLYITALILALIITPMQTLLDLSALPTLLWASILAMASKYILAINRKHLFNPAALAVALTAFVLNQPASWWIGNSLMMPLVLVGGLLLVRKIIRFDLVLSFLGVSLAVILATGSGTSGIFSTLNQALFHSPWLFFAFVMLTEPLTTPPTKSLRVAYGALTGFLFAPAIHLGSVYSTPELALLSANVFSYLVSPKRKYLLRLKEKKMIADDVYDFVFEPDQKLKFKPGQYLEWTLGNVSLDSRGNRRYFTVASAPEESDVRLGVKFYPHPS
ncbi:MAG TPA: RnfABCDGE type electron transport complex subunit D, partial [Candidatus Tyrphobacter sp.]|nr:RnfABCDGE type electron transport complex subunit D [Candidatus Tyrphobacter sp.]